MRTLDHIHEKKALTNSLLKFPSKQCYLLGEQCLLLWKPKDFHGGFIRLTCLRIDFHCGWISSQLTALETLRYDRVVWSVWAHVMIFHDQFSLRVDHWLSHRIVSIWIRHTSIVYA